MPILLRWHICLYAISDIHHRQRKTLMTNSDGEGEKILIGFERKLVAINPLGLKKGNASWIDGCHISSLIGRWWVIPGRRQG